MNALGSERRVRGPVADPVVAVRTGARPIEPGRDGHQTREGHEASALCQRCGASAVVHSALDESNHGTSVRVAGGFACVVREDLQHIDGEVNLRAIACATTPDLVATRATRENQRWMLGFIT